MSELIQKNDNRATIRWKLMTGASVLALTIYVSSVGIAKADDSGRPEIWIELGGQLSALEDAQNIFAPTFPNTPSRPSIFEPSQKFERPPLYSIDESGTLSFQPDNSDWIFSASVRYGRSSSKRHAHQQTNPKTWFGKFYYYGLSTTAYNVPVAGRFADTKVQNSEKHAILDFQAGKEVGLGMFGSANATSVLGIGIRFAQFASKSNIAQRSDPDWHFAYISSPAFLSFGWTTSRIAYGEGYHINLASLRATRTFHGLGPSLSWKGSVPFAGNAKDSSLSVDWELNAAMLFGRQRTKIHHQVTQQYHDPKYVEGSHPTIYHATPVDETSERSVTVPNVGGSIGLTWQLQNFKMSFGYKADFFFNAIDGGIDTRKNENRAFYGPYASISIGLGD